MGKSQSVPPPPPPSAAETELLHKQSALIDQTLQAINEQKAQNKDLGLITAVSSGLYTPVYDNGKLVDATLDPSKLAGMIDDFDKNTDINRQLADRFQKALNGELPVSEALGQSKVKDFSLTREAAARRGARITGGSLDEAAVTPQDSTGASETVGNLDRTYKLREDEERRGIINAGVPVVGGTNLALATNGQQSFGPGASVVGYNAVAGQIPAALQPYQQQRAMEYERNIQNARLRSQHEANIYGAVGQGVGIGAAVALA